MIIAPESLETQRALNLYRKRSCIQPLENNLISVEGDFYLNFSSNDYLGLAQDPRISQALCNAVEKNGVGATASRIICGHHPLHQQLEETFAEWMGYQHALLFSNGYMANLGVLEALSRAGASFCLDKFCHASLMMGTKLCDGKSYRYQHADAKSLDRQLRSHAHFSDPHIITEGIFSMEGDITPLPELCAIAHKNHAPLIMDDAHGIGVLGNEGRGTLDHFGLTSAQVPILILPLGKAFGTYGAMVLTNAHYRELILQFASTYTYTTNIPPALCAASLKSLEIMRHEPEHREKLRANISLFQHEAQRLGLDIPQLEGPIQLIPAADNATALSLQDALRAQGFYVHAVRAPTVPNNKPRIRITLNSLHERADIERLLDHIQREMNG